jgi:hypothetical protein
MSCPRISARHSFKLFWIYSFSLPLLCGLWAHILLFKSNGSGVGAIVQCHPRHAANIMWGPAQSARCEMRQRSCNIQLRSRWCTHMVLGQKLPHQEVGGSWCTLLRTCRRLSDDVLHFHVQESFKGHTASVDFTYATEIYLLRIHNCDWS